MQPSRYLAAVLLMTTCAGCQTMWGGHPLARNNSGRENPKVDDPWIRDAGDIARSEHPPEDVNDPLGLRKYFTSEKARDIERNVGVGD